MTDHQTPRIQYALESLPELLCERDLRLICNAIGLHGYAVLHRDNIRHYVEKAANNHEKRKAADEKEYRDLQQRAYELKLTKDAEGFYKWEGGAFPNGPTHYMFPMLPEHKDSAIPFHIPLIIEVEFTSGRRATLDYDTVNWSRVKRWKVAE